MKKTLYLMLGLFSIFMFWTIGGNVYATTSDFTITPVIPNNQIDGTSGYFNLLMAPGKQQDVSVNINNTSSNDIAVEVTFEHSTTNQNGMAIYDENQKKNDDSLKYNIENYVKIPQKNIYIPAHSSSIFKASILMTGDNINGVLAGGFTFKEKSKEASPKKAGVSIINEYRYVLGVVLQQNTREVVPDLKLNTIKASQLNSRNIISANLQNVMPTYLKDMYVSANVEGTTNQHLSYSVIKSELKMAPNSNFDLSIPTSNRINEVSKPLKPGKYKIFIKAYAQKDISGKYTMLLANGQDVAYKYKWTFEKDFIISKSRARYLNSTDLTIKNKEPFDLIMLFGFSVIILTMILLLIFLTIKIKHKIMSRKSQYYD